MDWTLVSTQDAGNAYLQRQAIVDVQHTLADPRNNLFVMHA